MGFFTCYPREGGHSGGSGHLILSMGLVLLLFTVFQTSAPTLSVVSISACPGPWGPNQHGQDERGQGTRAHSQFCLSSGWTARGLSCRAPDPVGSAGASGPKPVLPTGHEGPSLGDPGNGLEAGGTESPLICTPAPSVATGHARSFWSDLTD